MTSAPGAKTTVSAQPDRFAHDADPPDLIGTRCENSGTYLFPPEYTIKAKNSRMGALNPRARYRKEFTEDEVLDSPVVADPLRLLQICATSDGGAALVMCSLDYAGRMGVTDPVRVRRRQHCHPDVPEPGDRDAHFATDSSAGVAHVGISFHDSIAAAAYDDAGMGPDDMDLAEVYDLSSALELDWYENFGLCKEGEAERLLRDGDTAVGGRIPVNPSGGLGAFGEAVPAQAIAQVCEIAWQLRGQAGPRQIEAPQPGSRRTRACSATVRLSSVCVEPMLT